MYGIMLRLPILALNLTQDGTSGQDNGPERRMLLDAVEVRYQPSILDRTVRFVAERACMNYNRGCWTDYEYS